MTTPDAGWSPDRHADDGVLLALHDGERGSELDALRRHLEQCPVCQARLATIAGHAKHVHESLASLSAPPLDTDAFRRRLTARRTRRRVPLWRRTTVRAAAAVIVIAMAASASPARHWIQLHVLRSAEPVVVRSAAAPTAERRNQSGATVSFPTSGEEFTVRLDSLPAAGVLVLGRAAGDELSARVASGAGTGGDVMVVLPGELRFRNTTSSRASYSVLAPRTVTRLRVVVAGQVVFEGAPPAQVSLAR